MTELYSINSKTLNYAINTIIQKIDNGYELQDKENLDENELLSFIDSIIISPDYQREYRSSINDESSLIESVLLGIPIPPIFLANDRYEGVQVMNVVDGQHRLRAFHRFINNKFKLTGLTLLRELNGKYFSQCDLYIKEKIVSYELSSIVFRDFPGKDFELEIFNRYNKGTKPLTPQEIRHAVYNSKLNTYVDKFSKSLYEGKSSDELCNAYNATKDRFQKKKLQESIFVILSILDNGINTRYENSSVYAEEFMKEFSYLEKQNPCESENKFNELKDMFSAFNNVIEHISRKVKYPFSKEIYGYSSRNYKFQISIAMIIAGIFKRISNEISYNSMLHNDDYIEEFINYIGRYLSESFLEDPSYNASTTSSIKIDETVRDMDISKLINL